MADLLPRQFEFAGLVFGENTPITVADFLPGGKPQAEVQDRRRPRADGIAFGRDILGGQTLVYEFSIDTGSEAAARAEWQRLSVAWDEARDTPGLALPLRVHTGTEVRRVYGRPRRLEPASLQLLRAGRIDLVADFQAADHLWYSDQLQNLTISGVAIQFRTIENLVTNPSFEVDTSSWTVTRGTLTRDTTVARFGTASVRYDSDTAVTGVRFFTFETVQVTEGETYTASAYVLQGSGFTQARLDFAWVDSGDALISTELGALVDIGATWTRVSSTKTAPAGAVRANINVVLQPDPGLGAAARAFADAVMVTEGDQLLDYGDGDQPGWFWTGTPHASTSKRLSGGVVPPVIPPVTLADAVVESTVATNSGTAATWPVFTIQGPRHRPRIIYVGGEVEFFLDVTLLRDQSVTVDPRPWARSVLRQDGANLAGAMRGTRLSAIKLPPGDTELAFRGDDDTGLSSLAVQWRDADKSL